MRLQKGKGKEREPDLADNLDELTIRANEGEAANFGIFYDDSSYDYMQHLRTVGGDGEAVLLEAPAPKKATSASASKKVQFHQPGLVLPDEVLPAHPDDERPYAELVGIPERPYGLQPDMDPGLRQVLEALEDEAFLDEAFDEGEEGEEGNFFGDLLKGGERSENDKVNWASEEEATEGDKGAWQKEMDRFKRPSRTDDSDEDLYDSEDEEKDDLPDMPAFRNAKAKSKPRKGASSMGSMTSSALYRSEHLQNLDEHFERVRFALSLHRAST